MKTIFRPEVGWRMLLFVSLCVFVGCSGRATKTEEIKNLTHSVLLEAVKDPKRSEQERDHAAVALLWLFFDEQPAKERLNEVLRTKREPSCIEAAEALVRRGDDNAASVLSSIFRNGSLENKAYAVQACVRPGLTNISDELGQLTKNILQRDVLWVENDSELWFAFAASSLGDRDAAAILWATLEFYKPRPGLSVAQRNGHPLFVSAAEKLQLLGVKTMHALEMAIVPARDGGSRPNIYTDMVIDTGVIASVALADSGQTQYVKTIRSLLDSLTDPRTTYYRFKLAGALLQLGDDSRSHILLEGLKSPDRDTHYLAAAQVANRLKKQHFEPKPLEWWIETTKRVNELLASKIR